MILGFIKSGKPTQNAFTKRFNLTYLTEILDLLPFRMPNEAREITRVKSVTQNRCAYNYFSTGMSVPHTVNSAQPLRISTRAGVWISCRIVCLTSHVLGR
ncbi:TPA: transposase [Klebsiella quasipneumoniae subsp. quasipneumoniae]|nr:transposase [Klebsiella quasipneumoniae subsp. quasipneumoniae]HBU5899532.1 transposase [Klebsiella quasipneumoniae subsp. quasipneumoniae]